MTLYIVFINTKSKCMMISIIYTNLINRLLNSLSMPRLCVKLRKKYKLININMMHSIVCIYTRVVILLIQPPQQTQKYECACMDPFPHGMGFEG